ncbi:alpha/beta hydrolase [Micromonospora sp. WMMA1363]|uniref:alpha/beta fold hydrolase n=1 Tax=Micromonospora sp. WMMA1363 TaxID=3053985 RepID=UPI00259CFD3E|nr:alpha/beta hydrolase [Micromonospora sp. WMMA1363]MDM4722637.1 alpha/beta hydrolase [Micromonospora sp. WMMA1363]
MDTNTTPTTDTGSAGRSRRRMVTTLLAGVTAVGLAAGGTAIATTNDNQAQAGAAAATGKRSNLNEGYLTTRDGVEIFYKDWGPRDGRPVVFSHGWPLNSDSWESQMMHLADNGYRVIAHDRRGHGRSSQTWTGNDMDHYADDLATVITKLKLRNATLVGFSTGGGEVARYIGRHGTDRIAQVALIGAVTPLMLKTPTNPNGVPIDVFNSLREGSLTDRSQLYRDLAEGPFFGANRPNANVSQGMKDTFWLQSMQAGHKAAYDSIKAFSETDLTEDLNRIDVPTLIIHGDDDQVVPIDNSAREAHQIIKNSTLKTYPGGPHGITDTHKQQLNNDLLTFVNNLR